MTAAETILAFGVGVNAIGVIGGLLVSLRNGRKIDGQAGTIQKLETNTNSIKDALVKATAVAFEARGHAAGLEQGRQESK
jgi:hypothetical protein